MTRIVLLVVFLVSAASAASGQTVSSLEAILTPGRTVWITGPAGMEARARVISVSGGALTAAIDDETRQFRLDEIVRVRARHSDSLLNGALIGAGVSVGWGLFICRAMEPWEVCADPRPIFQTAALGASIGIAVDTLIRGRRTIYEAPGRSAQWRVSPMVGRAKGVQLSVEF